LAIDTTRRKFDCTKSRSAWSPGVRNASGPASCSRELDLLVGLRRVELGLGFAALFDVWASRTSSSLVRRCIDQYQRGRDVRGPRHPYRRDLLPWLSLIPDTGDSGTTSYTGYATYPEMPRLSAFQPNRVSSRDLGPVSATRGRRSGLVLRDLTGRANLLTQTIEAWLKSSVS